MAETSKVAPTASVLMCKTNWTVVLTCMIEALTMHWLESETDDEQDGIREITLKTLPVLWHAAAPVPEDLRALLIDFYDLTGITIPREWINSGKMLVVP